MAYETLSFLTVSTLQINKKYSPLLSSFINTRYRIDIFVSASEDMLESIDELKERLSSMKRMMEERKAAGSGTKDLFQGQARSLQGTTMIDGNFLSFVFGGSLFVILSVSVYAFYNLYHAVLKKFPSTHTEL